MDLVPQLREYHYSISQVHSQDVTYITYAGFWADTAEVSQEYLDLLDNIRQSARSLLIFGVPTVSHDGLQSTKSLSPNTLKSTPEGGCFSWWVLVAAMSVKFRWAALAASLTDSASPGGAGLPVEIRCANDRPAYAVEG